jgi:hypothetical protein
MSTRIVPAYVVYEELMTVGGQMTPAFEQFRSAAGAARGGHKAHPYRTINAERACYWPL